MKNALLLGCLLMLTVAIAAQESINNYKYIIVPQKFDFSSKKDIYRINTLTRLLFKEEGFTVYYDVEEWPEDLVNDGCLALYVDLEKLKGSIFKTKMQFLLKNCNGKVIVESKVGESRQKEYKVAYNEAIRKAFESFEGLQYKYDPAKKSKKDEGTMGAAELSHTDTKPESGDITKELKAQQFNGGYQLLNAEGNLVMTLMKTSTKDIFLVQGKSATVIKKGDKWFYSESKGDTVTEKELHIVF